MESLVYGALIFGAILALILVGLPIARSIEKRTGRHILDWLDLYVTLLILIVMSLMGLVVVYWGSQVDNIILVVIGLSITAWFGWFVLSILLRK